MSSSNRLLFCGAYWSHGGALSSGFGLGALSIGSIVIIVTLAFIFHNKVVHLRVRLLVIELRITVLDARLYIRLVIVILVTRIVILDLLNGLVTHGGLRDAPGARARDLSHFATGLTDREIWGLGILTRRGLRYGGHLLIARGLYRLSTLV